MRGVPVVRPVAYDLPLSRRDLSGLDRQGLARTLGAEIEMEEECMRPGEIFISPGVCGPDPRRPVDPYSSAPPTYAIPVSTTKTRAASSASSAFAGMSKTTMVVAGIAAVGLIYYLSKKR
jgi:hypothetical protein